MFYFSVSVYKSQTILEQEDIRYLRDPDSKNFSGLADNLSEYENKEAVWAVANWKAIPIYKDSLFCS